MIRNDNYSRDNFLLPEFDVSWPFYTVESDYLTGWACLAFALIFAILAWMYPRITSYWRKAILLVAAVGSLLVYSNFLTFHGPINKDEVRLLQTWDMFHYVLGARYQAELGYDHFYDASLLALREIETGGSDQEFWTKLSYRDMRTYELLPGTVALLQKEEIKKPFSEKRWQQFVKDIDVFYRDLGPDYFKKAMGDHGYNPPPTYTLLAQFLLGEGDLTETKLMLLASIDSVLLVFAFGLLVWGFGLEAALVSTIIFGISFMSNFSWVGNAFLRFGWLTAIVGAIVFQKKNRPVASGIFLGISAGLRIFPGVLIFVLAFPFLWSWWKEIQKVRNQDKASGRFEDFLLWKKSDRCVRLLKTTTSAAGILVFWVFITTLASDRASMWSEWSDAISLHSGRLSANHAGLQTAVTIDPDLTGGKIVAPNVDEWWNEKKKETLSKRSWIYAPILITYLGLLLACARKSSPEHFLLIGLTSLFFLIDLSGYYYSFMALLPLLFFERNFKNMAVGFVFASVIALVIMSQYWTQQVYRYLDWVYAISSLVLLFLFLGYPVIHLLLDRFGDKKTSDYKGGTLDSSESL